MLVRSLNSELTVVPPTGGEGANTALRDSASLMEYLKKAECGDIPIQDVVKEYEREMLAFSSGVVKGSHRMARRITLDGSVSSFFFRWFLRVANFFVGLFIGN